MRPANPVSELLTHAALNLALEMVNDNARVVVRRPFLV
jgi:hypothetical protein